MVTRNFGDEAWRLTLNEIVFFVGSILGGALISTWGGFKSKIHTLALRMLFMWSVWSCNGNSIVCKYVYYIFDYYGNNGSYNVTT